MTQFMKTNIADTTINTRFRCGALRARDLPLPVSGGPSRKTQQTFTRAPTIQIGTTCETQTEPRREGKGPELRGEVQECHTKNRRRRCQRAASCTMCQPPARRHFTAASKGQERGQRSAKPKRRERYDNERRNTITESQRRYANTGHEKHDAYTSEMSSTTSVSRGRDEDVKKGLNKSEIRPPSSLSLRNCSFICFFNKPLCAIDKQWCPSGRSRIKVDVLRT